MATKKQLEIVARRVWRMTADSPMGEYLELVPKENQGEATTAVPKRTYHPETPTSYGALTLEPPSTQVKSPHTQAAESRQPQLPSAEPDRRTPEVMPASPVPKLKIIRPAQVESWQSSSFDLLTGCLVRDVTETIPGSVFEELFAHGKASPHSSPRRESLIRVSGHSFSRRIEPLQAPWLPPIKVSE